jgi:outer membrane protein TolC
MKDWKMLAALPLFAGGLWAAPLAGNDLVLPEKVFPALDGVLKGAVKQSPRMLKGALDLEIAAAVRQEARAGLLPSFYASYSLQQARDNRSDIGWTNVQKVGYNATITQPLFYWGERRNNAHIGEIQQKISQGQYKEGYRLLAQDLRGRYLSLITQKVGIARARFNQKFTKELLRLAEDRLAKKVISDLEIFPTRLNAERADIDVEHTTFDFENAKQSYARLAGVAVPEDDSIPDSIPAVAYNPELVDHLLAGFVSLKDPPTTEAFTLRQQLEIQGLTYANQKTRLRPKVAFQLGTWQDLQSYTVNVAQKYQVNSYFAGLSFSWAIFDGLASQSAVRSSLARRRQLENDYDELTARLAQQARAQARQIYFSARTMSIDDRFLTSSEGNLRVRQDDFARGVISEAEVSLAQLSLFDTQINTYTARIDFLIKTGEFLGMLDEDPVVVNAPVN